MSIVTEALCSREEEVINLLDLVFNGWPDYEINCSKKEYWDWKYRENPIKKELIVVAKKDDTIVGCFHRMPAMVKIGSKLYLTSAGTDVAVHPAYRKLGMYNQMLDAVIILAENLGSAMNWGITGNPILVSKGCRARYGTLPYPGNIYTKIDDLGSHLKKTRKIAIIERAGFTTLKTLNKLKYAFTHENNLDQNIKIQEIEKYGSSIDTFWDNVQEEYKFVFERKKEYMNWRYCRSDIVEYRNIIATENNEIQGYAVMKIDAEDPDYKKGYIVDLLTYKSAKSAYKLLMKSIIECMRKDKVNFVCCLNTNPQNNILSRYEFLNGRRDVYFHYVKDRLHIGVDEKTLQESNPEEIHFCYGDGDWI